MYVPPGIELIRRLHPHIVLLGWSGCAGESLAGIKDCSASTRVIVLVGDTLEKDLVGAIVQGCCYGILPRKTSAKLMIRSIRKVHAGEFWLKRMTTSDLIRQLAKEHTEWSQGKARDSIRQPAVLNPREREITVLVAQGLENKGIAGRLFLTEAAVENDLARVFGKLGVSDRLELALYAIYHRLHETAEEAVVHTGSS
jgi:DNA-binding NarL/FixJ family response regulator